LSTIIFKISKKLQKISKNFKKPKISKEYYKNAANIILTAF